MSVLPISIGGAVVVDMMAVQTPDNLLAIHTNMANAVPSDIDGCFYRPTGTGAYDGLRWGVTFGLRPFLLPAIFNCRRGGRGIKRGISIITASAYANATGNGKCSFVVDIHQAHLRSRISAKVVGVH